VTTFGGQTIPGLFVGAGSFFRSPFILYDQDLSYTGNASVQQVVKFSQPDSALYTIPDFGIGEATVDTLPLQWRDIRPAPSPVDASVRRVADLGGVPIAENPAGPGPGV
jgi:hypothetical protein